VGEPTIVSSDSEETVVELHHSPRADDEMCELEKKAGTMGAVAMRAATAEEVVRKLVVSPFGGLVPDRKHKVTVNEMAKVFLPFLNLIPHR